MKRILTVLSATLMIGCGGGTNSTPTAPTSTPAASTFAVSGTVRDSQSNAALSAVNVQILDGPAANRSTTTDGSGNYSIAALTPAGFNIRFARSGYTSAERGVNLTQDVRVDLTLVPVPVAPPPSTPTAPAAPTGLSASVSGNTVTLRWNAVPAASDYLILIGTSSNSSNSFFNNTSQTTFVWNNVSPATYYARVQARNSSGTSGSSNEVQFTVATATGGGGGSTPPSSWPGSLPPRTSGSHPVCQATLPAVASCVNNIVGQPQAICDNSRYSCSTGSGTCSSNGGVYCWRQ